MSPFRRFTGFDITKFQASKVFSFYPRKLGEFFAEATIGHNLFINDIPKGFDVEHSKHFALIEATALTPLFALSITHYVSALCGSKSRSELLSPLQTESALRVKAMQFWLANIERRSPMEAPFFRGCLLAMQVATFPFWMTLAATAPPVVHCQMEHTNHIMASKYAAIASHNAPPFVGTRGREVELAQDIHQKNSLITTDMVAMAVLLFIIYWAVF